MTQYSIAFTRIFAAMFLCLSSDPTSEACRLGSLDYTDELPYALLQSYEVEGKIASYPNVMREFHAVLSSLILYTFPSGYFEWNEPLLRCANTWSSATIAHSKIPGAGQPWYWRGLSFSLGVGLSTKWYWITMNTVVIWVGTSMRTYTNVACMLIRTDGMSGIVDMDYQETKYSYDCHLACTTCPSKCGKGQAR